MSARDVIDDLRALAARTSDAQGAQRVAWGPTWRDARAWFDERLAVVGLRAVRETIEESGFDDGLDRDLVTHDAKKFFSLMLRANGYVLEQVHSPLVLLTTPEHDELRSLARGCVTRHHAHHYLGFAATQWRLFEKESPRRVKPLLYVFRVLLTGIHLMRSGEVEANLPRLWSS